MAHTRILKLDASWGEDHGSATLQVMVTTRPLDVGDGLCVTEGYRLRRSEAESVFTRPNDEPISNYWIREGSCDDIDPNLVTVFGGVPNAVMVGQLIATVHVPGSGVQYIAFYTREGRNRRRVSAVYDAAQRLRRDVRVFFWQS